MLGGRHRSQWFLEAAPCSVQVPESVEDSHLWRQVCNGAVPRDVEGGQVVNLADADGNAGYVVVAHIEHAEVGEHELVPGAGLLLLVG